MKDKSDYSLGTLEKAFSILDLFSYQNTELSLNEIKNKLNMPKATVFRLLFTMEKHGFVRRVNPSGKYRLGQKLLYLGDMVAKDYDIIRIARPFMRDLWKELGETVDLTVISNDQVLFIEAFESIYHLKAEYSPVGKKLPIHCTASGKILAAFAPQQLSAAWPPQVFEAYTPYTITDPAVLRQELAQVREKGYAMDEGELDENINSYSVPIFCGPSVQAALTVVVPKSRLNQGLEAGILKGLSHSAGQISAALSQFEQGI